MSKKSYFFLGGGERDMLEIPPIEIDPVPQMIIVEQIRVTMRRIEDSAFVGGNEPTQTRAAQNPTSEEILYTRDVLRIRQMQELEQQPAVELPEGGPRQGRVIRIQRIHPLDDGHVEWYDKTGLAHQPGKPSRELRYLQLRGDEKNPRKKLGEINAILEAEGYSEAYGAGVLPCPTLSHQIVRENKGARKMITSLYNG